MAPHVKQQVSLLLSLCCIGCHCQRHQKRNCCSWPNGWGCSHQGKACCCRQSGNARASSTAAADEQRILQAMLPARVRQCCSRCCCCCPQEPGNNAGRCPASHPCCKALLPLLLLAGLSTYKPRGTFSESLPKAAQVAKALLLLLLLLTGTVPAPLSPHTPASRTPP